MRLQRNRPGRGFTLLEMAFATAITALVVLGVMVTFLSHYRSYRAHRALRDMQQSARTALEAVSRDVRMAGYGVTVPDSQLSSWITWVSDITNNPTVHNGGSGQGRDALSIVAAFGPPLASLSQPAISNAIALHVGSGEGARFNTSDKSVIFIGRLETARIVSLTGDILTVSVDPDMAGKGLRWDYPVGTPVELVEVATYEWYDGTNAYPHHPCLLRDDHHGVLSMAWQKMVAGNVEDFQVQELFYSLNVDISVRAGEAEQNYTNPDRGDHFRRLTVGTRILPRNTPLLKLRY